MADRFEMAESGAVPKVEDGIDPAPMRSRKWRRAGLSALAVLAVAGGGLWLSKERLADRIIVGQLAAYGLPATYEIESIGPGQQILKNLVVGDPRRPDLTVERVLVSIRYRWGAPYIGGVTLVRPRLYGQYLDGKLNFGALDKVLFAPKTDSAPFALPKLDLTIEDGRGLMLTDYGKVGLSLEGQGALQDGFTGTLAASAPALALSGCKADQARLFGTIAVRKEQPSLTGPLRLASLVCEGGARSGPMTAQLDVRADKDFAGLTGNAALRGQKLSFPGLTAESLALDTRLALRDGALTGRVEANAGSVASQGVRFGLLGVEGAIRARDSLSKAEFRGALQGEGLRQGTALTAALDSAQRSANGTLVAPMLAQMRRSLTREERGSRLTGEVTLRRNGDALSVVVPQARLTGGSGQDLLALSRFQIASASNDGPPLLAGNITTGGAGLPRIAGRMERGRAGQALFRLTLAPWRAEGGSLAIPEMMIAQVPDGSLGFSGTAQVSGAIPGGSVQNLVLPVNGSYGARGDLALWKHCVNARFDRLTLGSVAVDGNTLALCPPGGSAIVRNGANGLRLAAGTTALELTGRLGDSPLSVKTGAVGFAWPGTLNAKAVDVTLGPPDTASR
ncbi:MAG: hypothetical protein B7Y74_05900, partial [Novosphingobium sp. 35-62-5]